MVEEKVMRSVYLWPGDDTELRQLAFDLHISKSDLIRAAIRAKLREWQAQNDEELLRRDLEMAGRP